MTTYEDNNILTYGQYSQESLFNSVKSKFLEHSEPNLIKPVYQCYRHEAQNTLQSPTNLELKKNDPSLVNDSSQYWRVEQIGDSKHPQCAS